jgi:hypothetical protein
MRRLNWPLWGGLLLVPIAVISYLFLFVRWPATRDVPWVPLLLFVVAAALLIAGWRAGGRRILASVVTVAGLGLMTFFTFAFTIGTKRIPLSRGAPSVGDKAPDFALPDTNHRTVALSQLLARPGAHGVLLIFYRGYW